MSFARRSGRFGVCMRLPRHDRRACHLRVKFVSGCDGYAPAVDTSPRGVVYSFMGGVLMRYGHFDIENREYAVDRVDTPVSWTNYIGTKDMCGCFNQTAGGYLFCGSAEYHRITRFRPNGVPADFPGHYIYIRDDDTGEYWSVSWQPTGGDTAGCRCRHGLSYSVYEREKCGIFASQRLSVAMDDPVELWDAEIENRSGRDRRLSVFSYAEFSFHQIDMDNRNFQMSLYAAGSRYDRGAIEYELHYEENSFQFFTGSFEPDGFDCRRDAFIGPYRTERDPAAVEKGECSGSCSTGGNHCAALMKRIVLASGESARLIFLLGEGGADEAVKMREKYGSPSAADAERARLAAFWEDKLVRLRISTPDDGMNALLNQWTLYQSWINVMFSRFSSFIEVGGRTGLGYRDTAQDAMCIPHAEPDGSKTRIRQLLSALTSAGYGLHLFEPRWFEPDKGQSFKSPTVVPTPDKASFVHGIKDACSDDALWLVGAAVNYIKETGDLDFADESASYADGGGDTVYGHLKTILDFSISHVGAHGICQGLRADWNDCLNLGGGESAMVSFLLYWALGQFTALASRLGRTWDAEKYAAAAESVRETCERVLWDGEWYIRGITADGRRIGTSGDAEGRVHLESNAWAVLSGAASPERSRKCLKSVMDFLFTEYGVALNAPPYTKPDDGIGFVTRVYPGLKENGSIFSHPNPWVWAAECAAGDGDAAVKLYRALSPYEQNDKIETRKSEPYVYCQFVTGPGHPDFGEAHHPFMTGTAGWAYFSATQYILGIRPDFDFLRVEPCIPSDWPGYEAVRVWRGAEYRISVRRTGTASLTVDGASADRIPPRGAGEICRVEKTI